MKRLEIALLTFIVAIMPAAYAEVTIKPLTRSVLENAYKTPSYESLIKLTQVQQMDKAFKMMLKNRELFNHFMQLEMVQRNFTLDDKNLSLQQREQAKKVVNDFMERVFAEQNNAEFRQQAINAYIETAKSVYTQQEVNALIQFYDNPIGQSLIEKQPIVMKQYTTNILPIIQNNSIEIVEKNLPKLYKQLDEIFKSGKK